MSLGYEVEDKPRSFDSDGITGTVSRYTKSKLEFPCFIVKAPFEEYKITVLRTMFQKSDSYDEEESKLAINLYFEQDGVRAGFGKIFPRQVNSFLKLFGGNDITGYYDDGRELRGEHLYVLGC